MKRRSLLTRPFQALQKVGTPSLATMAGSTDPENPFANDTLPSTARSSAGLDPYQGPWGWEQAAHLLRRCLFGPRRSEIEAAVQAGLSQTLNILFMPSQAPDPPVNFGFANDPDVQVGATWVNAGFDPMVMGINPYRQRSLRAWWIGLMINQGMSLREKMTLFWHNHFATQSEVYQDPRHGYKHINLLRDNALGNFKTLVEEITIDPAMLRFLNGNQNRVGRPNENYSRELFELFSIGKGPQIGTGNYTNYTEQDVIEAAKVLTGWVDRGFGNDPGPTRAQFIPQWHDTTTKTFSSAFGNHVISDNGDQEYKDLINMIFGQAETARYICRKLYRWFVYYVIDSTAETMVIEPMAQMLINNGFEIAPVLHALLESEHFFDSINMGCVIKNPVDYDISIIRQFEIEFPDPATDLEAAYNMWDLIWTHASQQNMVLGSPPSVAGWTAYYQEPQYYETWITSVTLPARSDAIAGLILTGIRRGGSLIVANPLDAVAQMSNPYDPNVVVEEFVNLLYPMPIDQTQKDFLKDTLIPGLPDFEWTLEYGDYINDPTDPDKRNAVLTKLQALLVTMMNMAEYHLS